MADSELPSFSLGLDDVPSFSLGIDNILPPTPAPNVVQAEETHTFEFHGDDHLRVPRRLKRLRRGPVSSPSDSTSVPQAPEPSAADDIEDFSSEDELQKSQACSFRSLNTLKPVKTPPVFERTPEVPSSSGSVSIKRTGLGSKEVKFQGVPIRPVSFPSASLQYSPVHRAEQASSSKGGGVPVYEFRDNQICIDIEDDDEYDPPAADAPTSSADLHVAQLLRQRLPNFSFVDDLEQENGGEPVYIDYRGQFGGSTKKKKPPAPTGRENNRKQKTTRTSRARKRSKQTPGSSQVLQENNGKSRKGYWVTEGHGKVYVTADGQRLQGKAAYLRYKQDSGQKQTPKQKQQRRKRKK